MEWQPIESAPKNTRVLVWAKAHESWGYTEARWDLFKATLHDSYESGKRTTRWILSEPQPREWYGFTPTHWMPLPPPPGGDK